MFMFTYVISLLHTNKNKVLNIHHGKQQRMKRQTLGGLNFRKSFTEETEGNVMKDEKLMKGQRSPKKGLPKAGSR